jgi:hypothetical protein
LVAADTAEDGTGEPGGDGVESFEPPDEDNCFFAGNLSKRFGFFLAIFSSCFLVG